MADVTRTAALDLIRSGNIPWHRRTAALRLAHAERERLRAGGLDVPFWLRLLDSQYHAARRKPRPRPAGILAQIRSDEQRPAA